MEIERLNSDEWQRLKAVRLAALADVPDAFGSTLADAQRYEESDWRQQLATLATFVAMVEAVDVGMARGIADEGSADDALLASMWVAPEARGHGVGEQLILAVMGWARAAGHSRLLLDVADQNLPAVALYERMGFEPTGETGSLPPPRGHVREHRRALTLSQE
jgi:GNAT superfamily N-acetyltransferase